MNHACHGFFYLEQRDRFNQPSLKVGARNAMRAFCKDVRQAHSNPSGNTNSMHKNINSIQSHGQERTSYLS